MSVRFAQSLFEAGRFGDALRECDSILKSDRNHIDALCLQGAILAQAGDLQKARTVLKRAVKLRPESLGAQVNLARVLIAMGDATSALAPLRSACALNPSDLNLLSNLASCCMTLGENGEAEKHLRDYIARKADDPITRMNLSSVLRQRGDFAGALEQATAAVELRAQDAAAHLALGEALAGLQRYEEAIRAFEDAHRLDPSFNRPLLHKANALRELRRYEDSIACCTQIITRDPDFAEAYCSRGLARHERVELDDAVADYRKALALTPNVAGIHFDLGVTYEALGESSAAIACYERAIKLEPNFMDARGNLYMRLLISGDFRRGWEAMEWRKKKSPPIGARQFPFPLWLGDKPIKGKKILIHWEQGLGDTLQFCRYIHQLAALGADVFFLPQPALRRLLKDLPARIVSEADLHRCDFHCPLLSLPLAFKTRIESIPAAVPYLDAEPELIDAWRAVLDARIPGGDLRIGIAWRGSGAGTLLGKSIPLKMLASLAGPGVSLISLQKNEGAEELAEAAGVIDLGDAFDGGPDAFVDTAAVMKLLDLVITVDTSIAHLAGALNVPTWVLLKKVPDWRWLLERSDTPWYPTMRLFRQPSIHDWAGALGEVQSALQAFHRAGS